MKNLTQTLGILCFVFFHLVSGNWAWSEAKKIGPVDPNSIVEISIALPLRNSKALDSLITQLYNPRSPVFGKYLSAADFQEKYSPELLQVDQVKKFLEAHQLQLVSVDDNRLLVHASGKVSSVNLAFKTELNHYLDGDGREFFAPGNDPEIPAELAAHAVFGLENHVKAKHHHVEWVGKAWNVESNQPSGLKPSEIREIYKIPNDLDGSGQTLAVFELDTFSSDDIDYYKNYFQLASTPVKRIPIQGAPGHPGNGKAEVTLDIELVLALAPKAKKILVYEGPNSSMGIIRTYNRIASDNIAKSVSTSWGLAETDNSSAFLLVENNIFKQMAAQGQSVFAASGDLGAFDTGNSTLAVDDPASQPFVTGVGGTRLKLDSSGNYLTESTWFEAKHGSGGGVSSVWKIPAWQVSALSPGSKASSLMRNVPDVSLNADPSTGYAVYVSSHWAVYGGTSCAAPLWAAFIAGVNSQRALRGRATLGFANPSIYSLGRSVEYSTLYHDILDSSENGFYPAVKGLDDATGWGSFVGDLLSQALVKF